MIVKATNELVSVQLRRRLADERARLRADMKGRKQTAYVYYLIEPDQNVIRYVGVAQCVAGRLGSHISQCRKAKTPVSRWVRSLVERGVLPRCEVVAAVSSFGGIMTSWVWNDFAVRSLEKAIVQAAAAGCLRSNLRSERFGGYRADLLNVEHLR